ncbi:MAG: lysozyme inhibitor LprI family protein [Azoarcus sp.]|jgi:uncharacterized protein YecT (DUF1311 family)|nr:lysozyme inhibitor LprI family protein [Azoarcus sp.]
MMKSIGAMKAFCALSLCFMGANVLAEDCGVLEKQADMNRCHASEYKAADRTLNDVYASYRATLDETRKKSLANAQNAWIKYRDLSCDFETSGAKGGSVFQMALSICLTEKTRARIEEIKKLSVCEEGDVSCSR